LLYFVKMNKFVAVAVIALAACAFAEKYTPKTSCSAHITTQMVISGQKVDSGEGYTVMNGTDMISYVVQTIGTEKTQNLLRCDIKDSAGKCLFIQRVNEKCTEDYIDRAAMYPDYIEYDTKTTVDCPEGGSCTKYCTSTGVCYYINKDDVIVAQETMGITILNHYQSDSFSMDVFAREKCDNTKLSAPTNPCAASITKAAMMVVLVALLVALL